jgi:HK97 gp10 family phage protein
MVTNYQITGLKETLQIFQELENEIGDKTARSKVLIPAVREAMKPVLARAKASTPVGETGLLRKSLVIKARKPNRKDKKSLYVKQTDTVIAVVTTKPIPAKLKKQTKGMTRNEKKAFYASKGTIYDSRAMANEFGTAKMAAQPFLRSSLESQVGIVTTKLGEILKQKIEKYRSTNL